jgi:DNA invertase Pin-like site-specific DNA recombinase
MKTPQAISYARFSTLDQIKGDSLRRQTEGAQSYCDRNNIELIQDFTDLGISAFKGKNQDEGALSEIIRLAKNGEIEKGTILIVESLDRISRQEINKALRLFLEILESGLDIVTLSDGERHYRHDKTELVDLIVSLVVLSRANEESEIKSKRIASSWKQKRKVARESGKIITSICPAWLKVVNGKFEVIEERKKVVEYIFSMSVTENLGITAITSRLNNEGIPHWKSKHRKSGTGKWSKTYIQKILDNCSVIGQHQPYKTIDDIKIKSGDPIIDYYPAIIPVETYNRHHTMKSKRQCAHSGRPAKVKDYNLFKSLVTCAECGCPMNFKSSGDNYKYLFCSAKCGATPIHYRRFETMAFYTLPSINLAKDKNKNNEIKKRNESREGEIIMKRSELVLLKDRWKKTKSSTIFEMIEELESDIIELESSMEMEESQIDDSLNIRIRRIINQLNSLDQSWRTDVRQNMIKVVKSISLKVVNESMMVASFELNNGSSFDASYNETNFKGDNYAVMTSKEPSKDIEATSKELIEFHQQSLEEILNQKIDFNLFTHKMI